MALAELMTIIRTTGTLTLEQEQRIDIMMWKEGLLDADRPLLEELHCLLASNKLSVHSRM